MIPIQDDKTDTVYNTPPEEAGQSVILRPTFRRPSPSCAWKNFLLFCEVDTLRFLNLTSPPFQNPRDCSLILGLMSQNLIAS